MTSNAQNKVQRLLDTLVRDGKERGIQLAAYLDGVLVIDAWSGIADAGTGREVDGETLFPVFSVTKGMVTTLAHLLVERGLLRYDTPIAQLGRSLACTGRGGSRWPALNHTAGLPNMPMGIGNQQLVNWEAMCAAIASSSPSPRRASEWLIMRSPTVGWWAKRLAAA